MFPTGVRFFLPAGGLIPYLPDLPELPESPELPDLPDLPIRWLPSGYPQLPARYPQLPIPLPGIPGIPAGRADTRDTRPLYTYRQIRPDRGGNPAAVWWRWAVVSRPSSGPSTPRFRSASGGRSMVAQKLRERSAAVLRGPIAVAQRLQRRDLRDAPGHEAPLETLTDVGGLL